MSASSKKKLRKEQEAAALTEKQLAAQKEAKKLKIQSVAFIVIIALVAAAGLGILAHSAISNSGIIEKNTTAVTVGEHKLNSAELNYFYVDAITGTYNEWYQMYGEYTPYYLPMMGGPDFTKPLSESIYDEATGETWADYFVQMAIDNAIASYALVDAAKAEGFTLSEEDISAIDSHMFNMENLYAASAGYDSLDNYLRASYGPGCNAKNFRAYCELTTLASSYQTAKIDSLVYDDAALRAYDAEHALDFNSYNYTSVYVSASKFLTGGTTAEDGTTSYSDEETAASVEAAKAAAESLLASESLVVFEKDANNLSFNDEKINPTVTDSNNTLYASVNSLFQEWIADEARAEGDVEIFANETTTTAEDGTESTTVYGYYVVFFEGMSDNTNVYPSHVRHLLVAFEGGTANEDGTTTYTEEEKQAALEEAEAMLETWKNGEATEDSFGSLVILNTDDEASVNNGGLYENIVPDNSYEAAFQDWAIAEHEVGDTGIVETPYGYHIMYYVGHNELNYRDYMIDNTLRSDDYTAWYTALVEAMTVTEGNTNKLDRDMILLTYAS